MRKCTDTHIRTHDVSHSHWPSLAPLAFANISKKRVFRSTGIPGFLAIEITDLTDSNPYNHKSTDLPSTLNIPLAGNITLACAAVLFDAVQMSEFDSLDDHLFFSLFRLTRLLMDGSVGWWTVFLFELVQT